MGMLLCAGDSGDNVSMIQAANVGIGIEGKICRGSLVCGCAVRCCEVL